MDNTQFLLDSRLAAPCYYTVPEDGADWLCHSCRQRFSASRVIYTVTPDGKRAVTCDACTCEDWKAKATNRGILPV